MCEYCIEYQETSSCSGDEGIMHDNKKDKYYFVAEHYAGERIKVEIKFCPWCGKELKNIELDDIKDKYYKSLINNQELLYKICELNNELEGVLQENDLLKTNVVM